jgi:uncharacterized membrane protein
MAEGKGGAGGTRLRGRLGCRRPSEPDPDNTGGGIKMRVETFFPERSPLTDRFRSSIEAIWKILERKWELSLQLGERDSASSKRLVTATAQSAVMSALIAVLTVISFPMPPPLTTITLAPAAIFVGSIFLGPRVGFISALLGSAIGFTIAATVGTAAGAAPGSALFPIFLLGIMVARGPEGYLIGVLRKKNEIAAMILGTVYETLAFFVIDFVYTYPVLLGMPNSFAFLDFGTLIDLIFIVPAIPVLRYLRSQMGVRYYNMPL